MYTSNLPGKYFSGQMDFGGMMEAATVLGALQSAFTTLVTQMGKLGRRGILGGLSMFIMEKHFDSGT